MRRSCKSLAIAGALLGVFAGAVYLTFRPNRTNVFYEYRPSVVIVDHCTIDASLQGTFHVGANVTTCGSPHELMVAITHEDEPTRQIEVTTATIINSTSNAVDFHDDRPLRSVTHPDRDGRYRTYVEFKKMQLAYENYKLVIAIRFVPQDDTERALELPLERSYRRYRSNDLIDMLLSG